MKLCIELKLEQSAQHIKTMTNKDLVSQEDLEAYNQRTGEMGMTAQRVNLPIIKISYEEDKTLGNFIKGTKNDDGNMVWKDLGKSFEAMRIRTRKTLRAYMDDDSQLYTAEYDSPDEILGLYQSGQLITQGTPKELRAQYTDAAKKCILKVNMVMYLLMGKELARMYVKGASLASLFRFYEKIRFPKDAMYNTKFTIPAEPEKKGKVKYYVMDFEMGAQYKDTAKVLDVQRELLVALKELKNARDSRHLNATPQGPVVQPPAGEPVQGELPAPEDDGEIDTSKIPF